MAKVTSTKLVQFLKDRGVYEDVDDLIIGELLYNVGLAKMAKDDIKDNGILDADSSKANPSVVIYNNAVKLILQIGKKLGIDPASRRELNIALTTIGDDGFDQD